MDRCRCEEYKAAVKKLKFYTVGTYRPDIIENFDKGEYFTAWVRHSIDHENLKFEQPKAYKKLTPEELLEKSKVKRGQQIEQMWCPYLTPRIEQ